MAELKVGTVVDWQRLSSILATFSLLPPAGDSFPDYKPGQYIALRRDDCRITKRVVGPDGHPTIVPVLDESGQPQRGPVTHSYSIASAPYETRAGGYLGFYLVLETDDKSVLLVGTGTGLAPFVSMIKQLQHDAEGGASDGVRYTLLHANRTSEELGYHQSLQAIEAAQRFDFVYLPSVSRPRPGAADPALGRGRANNVLRHIFGMPLREEHAVREAEAKGEDAAPARAALPSVVRPALPGPRSPAELRERLPPPPTVVLPCGTPSLMPDIKFIPETNGMRFEKEDW